MRNDNKPEYADVRKTAKMSITKKMLSNTAEFWEKVADLPPEQFKPLFKDKLMPLFAHKENTNQMQEIKGQVFPLAIRHRYFNKQLQQNVKRKEPNPTKQIVILGSGYDTRPAQKKKFSDEFGVRFFELDDQTILKDKEEIYQQNGIDKNATYIPIDYVKEDFINKLLEAGIDFSLPTHFLWEGNTYYLKPYDVDDVITKIKTNFSIFLISFDFVTEALLENRTGIKEIEQHYEYLKKYFDWKTGFDDIDTFAEKHQLSVLDQTTTAKLMQKYELDDNPTPSCEHHGLCTLSN